MGRTLFTHYRVIAGVVASLLLVGCTTHKQETPSLTGPSALGTSLAISVSPDTLAQDGASQSVVQISAFDNNGQPLRNKSMRVEIAVDGSITDFGRLSARNVVTDGSGRASITYTAPPPVLGITSTVDVQIRLTPAESDFGNATSRFATIHLVPTGVIGPPSSPFIPSFVPPSPTVGNPAAFVATVSGTSANAAVAAYLWDFGDGDTAIGQTVQHTFDEARTFLVTLGLVDTLGRTNAVTMSVTVGQGTLPSVVEIIASPSAPAVGQVINFNGSNTTVEAGHRIIAWDWTFGDGILGNGPLVQHSYQTAGEYTVTLRVTDDVGRESTLKTVKVPVGGSGGGSATGTTASFSITPPKPSGATGSDVVVFFDGSGSTAGSGAAIVTYVWTFSTGAPTTGQQTSRTFKAPGTYDVTLTVTDSKGQTDSTTQKFTVTAT